MLRKVAIYTDGACSGNPGKGGYAFILRTKIEDKIHEKSFSKGYQMTTNNRMELLGVIDALSRLKYPCEVTVYCDSQYVVNAINKNWLQSWINNNWKNGTVKNIDLWKKLLPLLGEHTVKFVWVKGHSDNVFNNRCDELAVQAMSGELFIDEGYNK